jgi:hypothetical protein
MRLHTSEHAAAPHTTIQDHIGTIHGSCIGRLPLLETFGSCGSTRSRASGGLEGGERDWGGRYPRDVLGRSATEVRSTSFAPQGLFVRGEPKADTPTTRHPPLNVEIPHRKRKRKETAWHKLAHHRLVEAAPLNSHERTMDPAMTFAIPPRRLDHHRNA